MFWREGKTCHIIICMYTHKKPKQVACKNKNKLIKQIKNKQREIKTPLSNWGLNLDIFDVVNQRQNKKTRIKDLLSNRNIEISTQLFII